MRVLVVEDQEKIAQSIKKGLEHRGYAADIVHDGESAIKRATSSSEHYDCILLDLMLPDMDGVEVCRLLREKGVHTPILMLTAKDTLLDKVEGLNNGADDYLVKPFEFAELAARIAALLRRPQVHIPVILRVGGLELNTVSRSVKKFGKDVPLTAKEVNILEQFMLQPNEVVSREKILNHGWDYAYDGLSNVVDVHVKNLRKKLQDGDEVVLETVHGLGYRLHA